jgi:hypothetical protein
MERGVFLLSKEKHLTLVDWASLLSAKSYSTATSDLVIWSACAVKGV